MNIQKQFIKIFGNPLTDIKTFERKFMKVFKYPKGIVKLIPALGNSIYCNINFVDIYFLFLYKLIDKNLHTEIKTFDGCFNPRYIRGSSVDISIHSFGMAIDLNAKDNPPGMSRENALFKGLTPFTKQFIDTALEIGLVAGYNFSRIDGMHFEHTLNK